MPYQKPNNMSEVWIGATSALLGSLIGAIVVMFQTYLNYQEKRDERREKLILKGIDKLNRDEVERSIGISIIEGMKIDDEDELDILIPALASQALFLLLHTKNVKSRVEFFNWRRIMDLMGGPSWLKENYPYYFHELSNAFLMKHDGDTENGVHMSKQTLEIWANKYDMDLKTYGSNPRNGNAG